TPVPAERFPFARRAGHGVGATGPPRARRLTSPFGQDPPCLPDSDASLVRMICLSVSIASENKLTLSCHNLGGNVLIFRFSRNFSFDSKHSSLGTHHYPC